MMRPTKRLIAAILSCGWLIFVPATAYDYFFLQQIYVVAPRAPVISTAQIVPHDWKGVTVYLTERQETIAKVDISIIVVGGVLIALSVFGRGFFSLEE